MTSDRSMMLTNLCNSLGYRFKRVEILEEALTHRSWCYQSTEVGRSPHNERLEFLGDAALGLCIATLLLEKMEGAAEGTLSTARQNLVRQETLARLASGIRLGDYLRLGQNEHVRGERSKASVLADALEAVFGAVYRDGGLDGCMTVVQNLYKGEMKTVLSGAVAVQDFKSRLQEMLQVGGGSAPTYQTDKVGGPDHQAVYEAVVTWGGIDLGKGQGLSKKVAEQNAAKEAITRVEPSIPRDIAYATNATELLRGILSKR